MKQLNKINKPEIVYSGESLNTAGKLVLYRISNNKGDYNFYVKIHEMIVNAYDEYVENLKIRFSSFEEALNSLKALIFYNTLPLTIHPDYIDPFKEFISVNMESNIEEMSSEEDEAAASLRQWLEKVEQLRVAV